MQLLGERQANIGAVTARALEVIVVDGAEAPVEGADIVVAATDPLPYLGKTGPDGKYRASSGFSFDQFNQDQILYFQYNDDNGVRRTGFTIADRANADIYDMVVERDSIMKLPEGAVRNEALQKWAAPRNSVPLMAQRIFVGRDPARNAIINLSDPNGKPRLRLKVDSLGAASLEFLDAAGTVTSRIPDR